MMSQVRHSERGSAVSDCPVALCYLKYYTNLSRLFCRHVMPAHKISL